MLKGSFSLKDSTDGDMFEIQFASSMFEVHLCFCTRKFVARSFAFVSVYCKSLQLLHFVTMVAAIPIASKWDVSQYCVRW